MHLYVLLIINYYYIICIHIKIAFPLLHNLSMGSSTNFKISKLNVIEIYNIIHTYMHYNIFNFIYSGQSFNIIKQLYSNTFNITIFHSIWNENIYIYIYPLLE